MSFTTKLHLLTAAALTFAAILLTDVAVAVWG